MTALEIASWMGFVVLLALVWGFVGWAWREALVSGGHIRRRRRREVDG